MLVRKEGIKFGKYQEYKKFYFRMVERFKKNFIIYIKIVFYMKEGKRCEKKIKFRKVLKEVEILFVYRNNL